MRDTPEWLHEISGQLLSVSGCLGEQHPRWGRDEDASREYQKRLMMQDGQYREFLGNFMRKFVPLSPVT